MDDYAKLIDRLRRIEALYSGATTPGERTAAGEALKRTADRLANLKTPDPAKEYRFTLDNSWSRKLFLALLRRHGHKPYRYPRQRYTTVMVRLSVSAADALWPEYLALDEELRSHLDVLAMKIIGEAVSSEMAEAEELPSLPENASLGF
jgi:hypothetical protein